MKRLLRRREHYKIGRRAGRRGWARRAGAGGLVLVLAVSIVVVNLKPGHASAAISLQGANSAVSGGTATSLAVTAPAGVASGSVLVAQVMFSTTNGSGSTATAPAGWVLAANQLNNGRYYQDVYYKVAGASEPASYSWTFSKAVYIAIGIGSYANVDNSNPIDAISSQFDGTASTTLAAPTVTATANGDMLLGMWGYMANTTATGYSGSQTQQWTTSTTGTGIGSAYQVLVNAGTSPAITSTVGTATTALVYTVALLPSQRPPGITFVNASTPATCTGCTSQSIAVPANAQAGDFLITSVFWSNSSILGSTVTKPSGWTQIGSTLTQSGGLFGTGYAMAEFYHVVGSSDPSSYTWSTSTSGPMVVNSVDYGGVDTAAPVDDSQTAIDGSSTTTHTAPSVTSTHSNDLYVGFWGFEGAVTAATYTSTMTQAWTDMDGSNIGSASAYEALGNPGTTGTRFATTVNSRGKSTSAIAMMHSIALKPFIPTPKLFTPSNDATDQKITNLVFQLKNNELVAGTLQYKIDICSNATCTAVLRTIDQSASQSGWSGQDAGGGTAYVGSTSLSGSTMATYTLTTPALSAGTQYWWRGYSYDPAQGYWTPPSNISTFTTSYTPTAPYLIFPQASASGVPLQPEFRLSSTDTDTDPVMFRIDICLNSTCSTILHSVDQTTSQTGWSGQDSDNFTAYATDVSDPTKSTVAYYDYQFSDLSPTGTYYWRAYAIDPDGSNLWSASSEIRPFTAATIDVKILNGNILNGVIQ